MRYGHVTGSRVPTVPCKIAFHINLWGMVINISQAVAFDLKDGAYYNAASGVFVMLALPFHAHTLTYGGDFADQLWLTNGSHKQQAAWNWGYTIWNGVFVLRKVCYIRPLGQVVAPMLFSGAWKPELWFQYRVYALHFNIIVVGVVGDNALRSAMPLLEDLPNNVLTALGITGLVYNVFVFIFIRSGFICRPVSKNSDISGTSL